MTFVPFPQNQSQTEFRKSAWDHVFDVQPTGARLLFEGTSWFFRMPTAASNRHCQIQGTVEASLEDGHFWIYIHIQKKKNFFMSTKKAQVDDIARISTSDTPRATLPPPRGGGAGHRLEGRKPVPLSNSRNMGHCVDDSPGLHVVPGPRVLSDANG